MRIFAFLLIVATISLLYAADPTSYADICARLDRRLTPANLRALVVAAAHEHQAQDAFTRTTEAFTKRLGKGSKPNLPKSKSDEMQDIADAILLLNLMQSAPHLPQFSDFSFCKWLFGNEKRLSSFMENYNLQNDNFTGVIDILHTLYKHDSADCDATWPLILAMALVWDVQRPLLHDQIGPNAMSFTPDIINRYDYFKQVLLRSKAAFPFHSLTIPILSFIIDTPVPVSELKTAHDIYKKQKPADLFRSINYDHRRIAAATQQLQYQTEQNDGAGKSSLYWPFGEYSLTNIQKHGGICTDQAYFTTLVLRANGIPAILLHGTGRLGGHAWVAAMKNNNTWDTEIGRYEEQKFTTGYANDPQTGDLFNDHLLPLICERVSARTEPYQESMAFTRLAELLSMLVIRKPGNAHELNLDKAVTQAAERAIVFNPMNVDAWALLASLMQNKPDKLNALLDKHAAVFSHYPDIIASFRKKQAELLYQKGYTVQADAILKAITQNNKKRDDITRNATLAQVDAAVKDNDVKKARLLFEAYLKKQREEGFKTLQDINGYLSLTKKTKQTAEAVTFLTSYIKQLKRSFDKQAKHDPRFTEWDTKILIQAYENNGNTQKAEKLAKKLTK